MQLSGGNFPRLELYGGGNFLDGNCPRGNCSRWQLPKRKLSGADCPVPEKQLSGVFYIKKLLTKVLQNSRENTCVEVFVLIKWKDLGFRLYQKKDSNTDDFL